MLGISKGFRCSISSYIIEKVRVLGNWRKCKWDKVFKSGPSKICERQPLKADHKSRP